MPSFRLCPKSSLDMMRVGQILPSLFSEFGIEDAVTLKFLRKNWSCLFNPPMTEHTFPKDLKNGILVVTVNSHAWLAHLKMLKDEFLKKLHPYGIKDMEFRFGRIYKKEKLNGEGDTPELTPEQQDWMKDIIKNIKDDEIRATTESLIKKYLLFINQINSNKN